MGVVDVHVNVPIAMYRASQCCVGGRRVINCLSVSSEVAQVLLHWRYRLAMLGGAVFTGRGSGTGIARYGTRVRMRR